MCPSNVDDPSLEFEPTPLALDEDDTPPAAMAPEPVYAAAAAAEHSLHAEPGNAAKKGPFMRRLLLFEEKEEGAPIVQNEAHTTRPGLISI